MVDGTTQNATVGAGMTDTLKPIHDIVIVRPAVVNDTTDTGIVIPQKSILKTCEGTVVAVGPGKRSLKTGVFTPTELRPGDLVLFGASCGVRMNYLGERLLVMREPDVTGVLDALQGNLYDPTPYYEQPEIRVCTPVR